MVVDSPFQSFLELPIRHPVWLIFAFGVETWCQFRALGKTKI